MSEPKHFFGKNLKLPEDLVPTSMQVNQFCGAHVHLETGRKWFDWPRFKDAVDHYPGNNLSFDTYKQNTIARSDATVSTMTDKIVAFLRDALSVAVDTTELSATIKATFINLKSAKQNGWADFSKSDEEENSSWEYRVLFSVPNPDLPTYFYALVTTIKLEADIKEESSWWGLVSSSSKNFSATIDAMELVVAKGFTKPS